MPATTMQKGSPMARSSHRPSPMAASHASIPARRCWSGACSRFTHENRPQVADGDAAWKDDVAPEQGAPFRPLYDDGVHFNEQPIALVVAEEWEIARYAGSLVRVDYDEQPFVTDIFRQRGGAEIVEKPDKPRGDAAKAFAAAAVRHEAEYFIPTEYHNPMELFASTAMWDGGGKLTVYDKTQGVQNVQKYLCGVFQKKSDQIKVLSPYMEPRGRLPPTQSPLRFDAAILSQIRSEVTS